MIKHLRAGTVLCILDLSKKNYIISVTTDMAKKKSPAVPNSYYI